MSTLHIANHSHLTPTWNWLQHHFSPDAVQWSHHSSLQHARLRRLPGAGERLARLRAASSALGAITKNPRSLLVSHGPRPAFYAARLAQWRGVARSIPHLVYSFNFTELPQGRLRREMARGFASVDRFTVFSELERSLYAEYFDLDPARIDRIHWGAAAPERCRLPRPPIQGHYICAVGSQGRDYATLLQAARLLPHVPLHIVAQRDNLQGLDIPPHVSVQCNVPNDYAQALIAHAELMVLPLRHERVPCGHVTAVSAMQLGVPLIASDSSGLHDYLVNGETAVLVPPSDPHAMASAIESGWEDPGAAQSMASRARHFAQAHCTEDTVLQYFSRYLNEKLNSVESVRPRMQA